MNKGYLFGLVLVFCLFGCYSGDESKPADAHTAKEALSAFDRLFAADEKLQITTSNAFKEVDRSQQIANQALGEINRLTKDLTECTSAFNSQRMQWYGLTNALSDIYRTNFEAGIRIGLMMGVMYGTNGVSMMMPDALQHVADVAWQEHSTNANYPK